MAAAAITPIDSSFIQRKFVSPTVANLMVGAIWGNAVALTQSVATSYQESRAVALAEKKAIDVNAMKRLAISKLKFMWPACVITTAAFAQIRGNRDVGWLSGIKPLAIVAAPMLAYTAYYRAPAPQPLRFGVISAGALHVYDMFRWNNKAEDRGSLPSAGMKRRIW